MTKAYHTCSFIGFACAIICGFLLFFGVAALNPFFLGLWAASVVTTIISIGIGHKIHQASNNASEEQYQFGTFLKGSSVLWICSSSHLLALTASLLFFAGHWLVTRNQRPSAPEEPQKRHSNHFTDAQHERPDHQESTFTPTPEATPATPATSPN